VAPSSLISAQTCGQPSTVSVSTPRCLHCVDEITRVAQGDRGEDSGPCMPYGGFSLEAVGPPSLEILINSYPAIKRFCILVS